VIDPPLSICHLAPFDQASMFYKGDFQEQTTVIVHWPGDILKVKANRK
jgi:hypothetical protein